VKGLKLRLMAGVLAAASFVSLMGCSGKDNFEFDGSRSITVVSREDGSGTRGAFIELLGIEEKTATTRRDHTTKRSLIANKTGVMLTTVQTDEYATGYLSMGSVNEDVKAVKIDGVELTAENVENGLYKLARPFVIAIDDTTSNLAFDFIDFILSEEGQDVVAESYAKIDSKAPSYEGSRPSGRIVVAGSSSVTPVMEKLAESYLAINPDAEIEIQQTDSTSGLMAVSSGTADIGMASRDLKESEKESLTGINIAVDAIAIIVNPLNPVDSLTSEQAHDIFTGEVSTWEGVSAE